MAELLAAARRRSQRIATAESCTGGMVAAALTEIPGASDVVECGFVTYSNAAKGTMLGVSEQTLARFGAVSEEIAREMAQGALERSDASLCVAITGIAGPGGSEFKPEGRVCFAVAGTALPIHSETVDFGALGRTKVRRAACDHALGMLGAALCDNDQ